MGEVAGGDGIGQSREVVQGFLNSATDFAFRPAFAGRSEFAHVERGQPLEALA